MGIRKLSAALGLFSIAAILVHIGYTVFAYLAFYYNPTLKMLTAVPFDQRAAVISHAQLFHIAELPQAVAWAKYSGLPPRRYEA